MPRTLPSALTTALDSGSFTAYVALGKRNYDADPPTALVDYTTLITNILYYKYDGLELVVKYASANMPATDGLTVGNKYYIERGVLIAGVPSTIKSASLRFDDYEINRQIVTAYFSLYSQDAKPEAVDGYDTYTNVLTALNPNADVLGTVDFVPTPENADHWGYRFYPSGKQAIPKSYGALLPHIRQKYLIQAVDNSDDDNEDEIQFYHLRSPVNAVYWKLRSTEAVKIYDAVYSPSLALFVAVGINATNVAYTQTSTDNVVWTPAAYAAIPFKPHAIDWSEELGLFVMAGIDASGTASIATSPDGTTWTNRVAPDDMYDVLWCSDLSLFVAVGKYIATSPDGITWTERTKPGTNSQEFQAVAWSPSLSLFAAVAWVGWAGEHVMTSPDGITWTEREASEDRNWRDIAWSPTLGLFVAVSESGTQRVMTSSDGITWTGRDHAENVLYETVTWAPFFGLFYAAAYEGNLMYSDDGITWTAEAAPTASVWEKIYWSEDAYTFVLGAVSGTYNIIASVANLAPKHILTQGDVTLLRNGKTQMFLWRDEDESIHTSGEATSIVHNLGYLESTDSPPVNLLNTDRGKVTVGIHLKYKTGDIFKIAVNSTQYAVYHARVTEILDPAAAIGWRCEVELIERFENTAAGALPGTIERIASYTPLVTNNFNGFLDSTVNNLQAFAERVDDAGEALTIGWVAVAYAWTRTSASTFTIVGDYSTTYEIGLRVRWTDGSTRKYGVVISSSYAAGTGLTTVTLAANDDYAIVATTIVGRHITRNENPQGYPHYFNYTPTFTNLTVGDGTLVARFNLSGKKVYCQIHFTFGPTTSAISGSVTFTIPVGTLSALTALPLGVATMNDAGAVQYAGIIHYNGSTTVIFRCFTVSGSNVIQTVISGTVPFTWGNGDRLVGSFQYFAA